MKRFRRALWRPITYYVSHFAVLVGLALAVAMATDPVRAGEGDEYVAAQVLVKLKPDALVGEVAGDNGLDTVPLDQFGSRPIFLLQIADGAAPPQKAEQLLADSRVPYSAYGHGTHVAGLVALAAPGATIVPVRILRPDGSGNHWVLVEGLEYAIEQGVDVINLSFSFTQESDLLEDLIEDITCGDDFGDDAERTGPGSRAGDDDDCLGAAQRGVVVVAAAGNRSSSTPEYPAAEEVDGLLAVAASTANDRLAAFSNRGPWVDVAAPGAAILSAVPDEGYGVWDGTSMAAPLVAGAAALVRANQPELAAYEVSERVVSTAAPLANPDVPRRVDAGLALGVTQELPDQQLHLPVVLQVR